MNTKFSMAIAQADPSAERLSSAFQQVMRLPPEPGNEAPLREQLHLLMGALTARQDLKRDAKLQSMLLACRLRLRRLLHGCASAAEESDFLPAACELRDLAEDICTAADLLLSSLGRSVLFEADEAGCSAACAPRELSWLLLEAICNAFCHTKGREIAVDLERRSGFALLRAASEGELDLPRLHAAASQPGTGTNAMLRIAWLHGGSLLWHEADGKAVCTLRIPLRPLRGTVACGAVEDRLSKPSAIQSRSNLRLLEGGAGRGQTSPLPPAAREQPDFVQLLCDKLSPVYTALAPCIGTMDG